MNYDKAGEISKAIGIPREQILRDFIQSALILEIFQHVTHKELVLKGGMSMKTAFGSERFTKDIDLQTTNNNVSKNKVKETIEYGLIAIRRTNLLEDLKITIPKQTDTVQRWKINGKCGESHINLTIEVSRRNTSKPIDEQYLKELEFHPRPEYELKPERIQTLSDQAIAAGKLAALSNVKRVAPRDIWDLHILISMNIEPPIELLKQYDIDELDKNISEIWSKADLMTYDMAKESLFDYMPKQIKDEFNEEKWEDMKLKVIATAETWMIKAKNEISMETNNLKQR